MNNVSHKKTLDFIARTFYNPNQEHISNAMMEKFNVQIFSENRRLVRVGESSIEFHSGVSDDES